jgi:hypothetical protein
MSTNIYSRPIESDSFAATLDERLFSPYHVAAASFFGGPLAGFVLIAVNFTRLGDAAAAKGSAMAGLVLTALLWLTVYSDPLHATWYAAAASPVLTAVFLWLAAHTLQGPELKAHAIAGGETASLWTALEIGVLAAAAQVLALAGVAAMAR